MKQDHRRWLRESIQEVLTPALAELGFRDVSRDERKSEAGIGFPFGMLGRPSSDGIEAISIQLGAYREPTFRISLGIIPLAGVEHPVVGHVPADELHVHHLGISYDMYDVSIWPFHRKWFGLPRFSRRQATKADYIDLVRRVAVRIPEIQNLFERGEAGRLRKVVMYDSAPDMGRRHRTS